MTITPSFSGWRAIVCHRSDEGIDRLVRQLNLLGLNALVRWSPIDLRETPADIVLVDADQGWAGQFPWAPGAAPVPVVALLQSEAPGRIAWAIEQGVTAVIAKPIAPSAVYPALVMGASIHAERAAAAARLARLNERVKLRPLVYHAVAALQDGSNLDEDSAYSLLRRTAMTRRLTIEQIAAEILAGIVPLTEVG